MRILYYWLVVLAIGALIIGQSVMPMMPAGGIRRRRSAFLPAYNEVFNCDMLTLDGLAKSQ